MRAPRLLVALAAAALLAPLGATTASAAPTNDTVAGATAITSLPKTITQDTTRATTDSVDAQLNELCGAPATNGSVWFTYTDTTGTGLLVDLSESSFSAGVAIVAGDPTAWHRDEQIVRLCRNLTWMLVAPCVVRVGVQLPIYLGGRAAEDAGAYIAALGVSKILMGWPLQLAALGGMVWLLARDRTPVEPGHEPELA